MQPPVGDKDFAVVKDFAVMENIYKKSLFNVVDLKHRVDWQLHLLEQEKPRFIVFYPVPNYYMSSFLAFSNPIDVLFFYGECRTLNTSASERDFLLASNIYEYPDLPEVLKELLSIDRYTIEIPQSIQVRYENPTSKEAKIFNKWCSVDRINHSGNDLTIVFVDGSTLSGKIVGDNYIFEDRDGRVIKKISRSSKVIVIIDHIWKAFWSYKLPQPIPLYYRILSGEHDRSLYNDHPIYNVVLKLLPKMYVLCPDNTIPLMALEAHYPDITTEIERWLNKAKVGSVYTTTDEEPTMDVDEISEAIDNTKLRRLG